MFQVTFKEIRGDMPMVTKIRRLRAIQMTSSIQPLRNFPTKRQIKRAKCQENKTKLQLAYISRSMSALDNNILSCMHTIRSLIWSVSRSTILLSKATGYRKSIKHDEQQLQPPWELHVRCHLFIKLAKAE